MSDEGIKNVRVLEKPLGFEETVDAIEEAIEAIKAGKKFSNSENSGSSEKRSSPEDRA